jgi:hypothetical protein
MLRMLISFCLTIIVLLVLLGFRGRLLGDVGSKTT